MTITKAQERTLARLERKLSKKEAPHRDYFTDLKDINELARAGVIDNDHALILSDRAKASYKAAQDALKPKKAPGTPIGVYMRPRPRVVGPALTDASMHMGNLINAIMGLIGVIMVAFFIF